jgi:hypothetical protein
MPTHAFARVQLFLQGALNIVDSCAGHARNSERCTKKPIYSFQNESNDDAKFKGSLPNNITKPHI